MSTTPSTTKINKLVALKNKKNDTAYNNIFIGSFIILLFSFLLIYPIKIKYPQLMVDLNNNIIDLYKDVLYNLRVCENIDYSNDELELLIEDTEDQIIKYTKKVEDLKNQTSIITDNLNKSLNISFRKTIRYNNNNLDLFDFGYINQTHIELDFIPDLADILDNHTLLLTDYEHSTPEDTLHNLDLLKEYLPYQFNRTILESQYYIRYVDEKVGYGLFANVDFAPDTVIDEYIGVLTLSTKVTTDYLWSYPLKYEAEDGTVNKFGIDAKYFGNALRFVNHKENPNSESVYVPYDNMWRIFYVSIKHIPKDSEITVSYGSNYWSSRDIVPK